MGTRTQEVVEKILEAQPHPEMGYRSCLGILPSGAALSGSSRGSCR